MARIKSPSQLAWTAAGNPAHGLRVIDNEGVCAVCATRVIKCVALDEIETPTTSDHANIFRHSRDGVCEACAWLFMAGKGRPGNYIATPDRMEYAVISLESVVADKRPWLAILRELATRASDTPVCGVMTTDVKPRLFPRTRIATIGTFGLYVHALDYDVSEWRAFDLPRCLEIIEAMLPALAAGFAKRAVFGGLLSDHARASADIAGAVSLETTLASMRGDPAFLPALIAAGVTKEDKKDVKRNGPRGVPAATPASSNHADQDEPRLL